MSHENRQAVLEGIDVLTEDIRGDVAIYSLISPENETREKQRFEDHPENSGEWMPSFSYSGSEDFSDERERVHRARNQLNSADLSDTVQELYKDTLCELEALLDIGENIEEPDVVRDASRDIYGEPSDVALEWARGTLENTDPVEKPPEEYSADQMIGSIDSALDMLEMDGWSTTYTDSSVVSVNGANREIRVPEDREFTENEMKRLLIHEVGVHALRSANGYEQGFQLLGSGAGGYHVTGEGLALFMEEETGLANPDLKRKYAGRALSVQSVLDGDSFQDTYRMNRGLGFDHGMSWDLAVRAHRGGGFIKDHVYAEGFQQVNSYLNEEDGDLEDIMVGKASIEQGQALRQEEGLEPDYNPGELARNLDELTPESVDTSDVDTWALDRY